MSGPTADDVRLRPLLEQPDLPILVEQLNQRMTTEREARERFQRDLTPSMKSEFILGEVVVHSPAKAKHLRATKRLVRVLDAHVERHRLGEVFTEKPLISLTRNDYEPDIVFFLASKASSFTDDQMQFPPPDFIVEFLSDSTESRDRGIKFNDYADHGVPEYWIVDCHGRSVEQYVLRPNRKYKLAQKMSQGVLTSVVVTDFTIPIAAIFDADALADHFATQG